MHSPKAFLTSLFMRAVEVADPMRVISKNLLPQTNGRMVVIGAGKASARMAEAVEHHWEPCEGLVITRYGYTRPTRGIEIVEAGHPIPDETGVRATKRILNLLGSLDRNDHVLALISGGGSALLCAPAHGLSLAQKQEVNNALLVSGAPISIINTIRKSLSRVKGGRLAQAAYPAKFTTLMISDVPGDDPRVIASGPSVAENIPAEEVIALRKTWLPDFEYLDEIIRQNPIAKNFSHTTNTVIAAPSHSLRAAEQMARAQGIDVTILGDDIEGEARQMAKAHAKLALDAQGPHLFLSGGELTVTKRGNGVGGPNAEYALALAIALNGATNIYALACDTDGVDGTAEVAGAYIDPTTLKRATHKRAECALANNDVHSFFATLNDQIVTGPTFTNVNDFRAIWVN